MAVRWRSSFGGETRRELVHPLQHRQAVRKMLPEEDGHKLAAHSSGRPHPFFALSPCNPRTTHGISPWDKGHKTLVKGLGQRGWNSRSGEGHPHLQGQHGVTTEVS